MKINLLILTHRIVLFSLLFFFFAWLFNEHIPFAGRQMIEYTSGVPNSRISRLHPLDRVQTDERMRVETIVEDPVYFEVKAPVPYDRATIQVRLDNRATMPLKLGIRHSPRMSDIELSDIETVREEDGWSRVTASFALVGSDRFEGRYHFVFSLPGLQHEYPERGYVRVSGMTVTLEREPIW